MRFPYISNPHFPSAFFAFFAPFAFPRPVRPMHGYDLAARKGRGRIVLARPFSRLFGCRRDVRT